MWARTFKGTIPLGVALILICSSAILGNAESLNETRYNRGEPVNCYICDTPDDCSASLGKLSKCERNDDQTCITVFDESGSVIKRGCSDEVYANPNNYCLESSNQKCVSCEANGCNDAMNIDQFYECLACDSMEDANCYLNPTQVKTSKLCSKGCLTVKYAADNMAYHLLRGCVEDIELDDREQCEDSKNSDRCRICSSANCNNERFEERHLSCYHCTGDACAEDIQDYECVAMKENDQCYIQLDENMDFIGLGCVSDLKINETEELIKNKELYTCDTDNCNLDAIKITNNCASCESDTNANCATNPKAVVRSVRCVNTPFTQCYERVRNDTGTTERGCLYDLETEEFFKCLTSADANCRICNQDNCNKDPVPANRIQCHRCDTLTNPNCEFRPDSLGYCPIYTDDDKCVSFYENGVTRRGCSNEVKCDPSQSNCEACSSNGCNTVNIRRRAEELYGILQDLPITCYTCKGDNCTNGKEVLQVCNANNNIYQDCMTVFDRTTGKVLERGCSDTVLRTQEEYCFNNPNQCFNCKGNGCNIIEDPTKFNQCLSCSSIESENCLTNPSLVTTKRKCHQGCITVLYPSKLNPLGEELVRGCHEDLDYDDQLICTGETDTCKKCFSDSCNTVALPETGRLSCFSCNGGDCSSPTAKQCRRFYARDQCYTYFDNQTSLPVKFGCRSDLMPSEISENLKNFYLCDGDNCNSLDKLPEPKKCLKCNSLVNPECASNPEKLSTYELCDTKPTTHCYTRVDESGHTQRGCLQSLSNEDYKACNSGDPKSLCRICTEENCNVNIFPSSRQRCYRCNSLRDPTCESAPTNSEACPLYREDDQCISKTVNYVTYRGCASELDCSGRDRRTCQACQGNNCNSVDLIANNIAGPGLFQQLPLNCYHCTGAEECQQSLGQFRKCEGPLDQTCTTVFDSNGLVTARGCSNVLNSTCFSAGSDCFDCHSNGCNVASNTNEYVNCWYCNAKTSRDCVFNAGPTARERLCYKNCMTALYPRTNDPKPAYELIRTCLDDMDFDDRNECLEGKMENCKACEGAKCNTDVIGKRISCYQCKDDECMQPEMALCKSIIENDQCFIEYDENRVLAGLGCKSDYDPADLVLRIKAKRLVLCEGDNCNGWDNIPQAQQCAVCSSITDENCATSPNAVQPTTTCSQSLVTECYTRVLASGETNRGCAKDLNGDDYYDCIMGSDNCTTCSGNNCNREIYPADRLSCHICDSKTSSQCDTSPNSAQTCALYDKGQMCVSKLDAQGNTMRGCSTKLKCEAGDAECRECSGNNCNVVNLKRKADGKPGIWQDLPLKCYTCNTVADCALASSVLTECPVENDYCMTVFNGNGMVRKRGCSSAVEAEFEDFCDSMSGNCFNCNSNGCNNAASMNDYIDCVYCDSKVDPKCVTDVSKISARRKCNKQCMTALLASNTSSTYGLVRTCLDDKDVEDQEKCSGDLCSKCGNAGCNTVKLPADRLSCYTCDGLDGCEDFEPTICLNYKPDDKCYQLYNNESSIIKMGCISDLDDSFVDSNFLQLYTCSGDFCNTQQNTPKPYSCAICNSETDVNCAISPADVGQVTDCTNLPTTQCYTRVLTDGSTERGCINSLSNTLKTACLKGTSADCQVCEGNRCNIDIFPVDRPRCQRCNSVEDPLCARSPDSSSVCPRYRKNEGCSSKLVDGDTYRGCNSEFICDDTDKQYCRNCNGTNCNVANLVDNVIGYPDRWDMAPISCYHCEGIDCIQNAYRLQKCEGNLLQNCVTVFVENGTVMYRGCSEELYETKYGPYCDANQGHCQFCKSSECNVAQSLADYVDCYACDGKNDKNCVFNLDSVNSTRKCYKGCFTALYARSQQPNPVYELERGCWDDLTAADRQKCGSEGFPNCDICTDDHCNTKVVPEDRLKCYYCADEQCSTYQQQLCTSYREDDRCYILYDKTEIKSMGCLSDYDQNMWNIHFRFVFTCEGDNCNTNDKAPDVRTCMECDSDHEQECAIKPDDVINMQGCNQLPYTDCYVRVSNDGVTYRGCLESLSDELFYECLNGNISCSICNDKNNCNTDIFPTERRRCLICDSSKDPDCASRPSQYSEICRLYVADQECVTKVEGDRVLRGCATQVACDPNDSTKCSYCQGDDCNTKNLLDLSIGDLGLWQDLPLNCYKCQNADCANGALGKLSKCEGNLEQSCMTVFGATGNVMQRDCSDKVTNDNSDYCTLNPDKCQACKSNGCNNAVSLNDYIDCYFCDSESNPRCGSNFDPMWSRKRKCHKGCMIALYPKTSGPANQTSYELSRSCLDDLDMDDQQRCKDNEWDKCFACDTELCNSKIFPEDRHQCYVCPNNDCSEAKLEYCSTYQENDQCYMVYNGQENELIGLGCRSDLMPIQIEQLIKSQALRLCDGIGCNGVVPSVRRCQSCSSDDTVFCATNPNLLTNTDLCSTYPYTDCYTRIIDQGITERGCLSSLNNTDFYHCLTGEDPLCQICQGDNCNGIDVFPATRLKCHKCSSSSDPNCESNPNNNRVCDVYDPTDYCLTSFENGVTRRGCASELKCSNPNNTKSCNTCSASGCNTLDMTLLGLNGQPGLWQPVPISCLACKGENCTENEWMHQVCAGDPYQNCMTVFDGQGEVVQRGCSDWVEMDQQSWCSANKDKCFYCNSNDCNNATSMDQYVDCWSCDTATNPKCAIETSALTRTRKCNTQCMTAMYPRDNETNPAYVLTRSCLDDMERPDQWLCLQGEMEYCQACGTEKCNSIDLPKEKPRLSCWQCSEDDCSTPEAKLCPFYRDNDQCYIKYDETGQMTQMGCRSEFTNHHADYLLMKKQLVLCDGDNCNTLSIIPAPQTCTLCNSRVDRECAQSPQAAIGATTCERTPYTHCYSRVLDDGATERGCISSLEGQDFLNCLDPNVKNCTPCLGPFCNKEVFPQDRLKCHICSSEFDPECVSKPNHLNICPLYNEFDMCVTALKDGVTHRGCASSLTCDPSNPRGCDLCDTDGCNTINIAKKQDDNYGKWQDLPLTCHRCAGSECLQSETTLPVTCQYNNEQDCMIVFGQTGGILHRGCSDEVDAAYGSYCDENPDNCIGCKSNLCNNATSQAMYTKCIYCDSEKDVNCLWDPLNGQMKTRHCDGGCMTVLYPTSSTPSAAEASHYLIRTCLNDKEEADRALCSSQNSNSSLCLSCQGDHCNTAVIPEQRFTCYHCEEPGNCETPTAKVCPLYKAEDHCYLRLDERNDIIDMGCLSSFRNQSLVSIIKTKRVVTCETANCNTAEIIPRPQKCTSCNSMTDRNCAVNAFEVSNFTTCNHLPYPHCYNKVLENGHTVRGCVSDLDDEAFAHCVLGQDENCAPCLGDACNRNIFPEDRLQCFTCSSEEEANCDAFPTYKEPCPLVNAQEKCISSLSGNMTIRGCSSSVFCDANDPTTCRSCQATECNAIDLLHKTYDPKQGEWQDLPLKCHTCAGEHCLVSLGPTKECVKNAHQQCMTVFDAEGHIKRRGCEDEVEDYEDLHCRLHPALCHKCKSNECNDAWDIHQYLNCTYCHSTDDPNCILNPLSPNLHSRWCKDQCMVALKDGHLIRSCLDDKDIFHQGQCSMTGSGTECARCNSDHCNTFKYPTNRLSCHVCADSKCLSTKEQLCLMYDENDFCFAKTGNDGVDLLGCASAQNKTDLDKWREDGDLYECKTDNCNKLDLLPVSGECVYCNSSVTPDCAKRPENVRTKDLCTIGSTQCATLIKDGHTIRQCLRNLPSVDQTACANGNKCSVCDGSSCNNKIYPADRRKCYQCNNVRDGDCEKQPSSLEVCLMYQENDSCVAKRDKDGYAQRGCASDLSCGLDYDKCYTCTTDGCNTDDISFGIRTTISSFILTILLAVISMTW